MSRLSAARVRAFRSRVLGHYRAAGRDLPWRRGADPWGVLVSEVMLQQTQVSRVAERWGPFLEAFPHPAALATAPLESVLALWRGLGYNRRALALQRTARAIRAEHGGRVPADPAELVRLPGIGPATAGAIAAFAFGRPAVFVETNIRRVFLHEFFPGREAVADRELLPLVERTLDASDPARWYHALMDYGADLAGRVENPNRRSAAYARQGPFEGSDRQVRGRILRRLLQGPATASRLSGAIGDARVPGLLERLAREGLVARQGRRWRIATGGGEP